MTPAYLAYLRAIVAAETAAPMCGSRRHNHNRGCPLAVLP